MLVDDGAGGKFLIDCGATAMIGIRKFALDPNEISAIFVSHMHGDHFAGVPFFILDAQLVSKRTAPLSVYLPTGGTGQFVGTMEGLFPGSYKSAKKFPVEIKEMAPGEKYMQNAVEAVSYKVNHSGLDARALRLTVNGKSIAYSGDTQWDDNLLLCAAGADVFVAEAYYYDRKVKFHLDLASLRENIAKIGARQYVLTHMAAEMLAVPREDLKGFVLAEDGLAIKI
jgi:ribonuclease BN (tRNA processing enzyme)